MKKIIRKIVLIFHKERVNYWKTFYFNFMMLPFAQAKKFPVLIYGPCHIASTSGRLIFNGEIKKGVFKIGCSDAVRSYFSKTYIDISGILELGNNVTIRRGANISVKPSGHVSLGDNVYIGDNNTIISQCKIIIGASTRVGNDTTFMDTDFHYVVNTKNGEVKLNNRPIEIGINNWIGGNCIIKKGAKTPFGTILAGPYSMIGKDYTKTICEFSMIGGSPAKLIAEGYRRVNNPCSEKIISNYFVNNNSPYIYSGQDYDNFCMPQ